MFFFKMKCLLVSVLVAEVTQPSLGVGYEIGRAVTMKKPILCLYRPSPDKRRCFGTIFFLGGGGLGVECAVKSANVQFMMGPRHVFGISQEFNSFSRGMRHKCFDLHIEVSMCSFNGTK